MNPKERIIGAAAVALALIVGVLIGLGVRSPDKPKMERCTDTVHKLYGGGSMQCEHPAARIKAFNDSTFLCKCPDSTSEVTP